MDGWLGVLYRHEGKFKVASRGSFHSEGALWATDYIGKFDLSCLPDEATLCFEIINPKQRIILDYGGQTTLVVLAAFNRCDRTRSRTEYPRQVVEEWAAKIGLPIVKRYEIGIEDCLKAQKSMTGQEGYVVVFADGRRAKIKTEWYLKLAKIMANMSPISLWEAMEGGKVQPAFLAKIPEELRTLSEQYRTTLEGQYASVKKALLDKCQEFVLKHGMDRKTVALNRECLKGTPAYRAVFAVLDGNEKAIDKIVMAEIYPASNEFVAIKG